MANGQICVLYSPLTSVNGAKLLLNKGPPRKATIEDMSDAVAAPTILTPHALPMFRDGDGLVRGSKRKREKERMDPRKSKRPELPVTGPGRGGRVGASATQHVVQNLVRDTTRDEDVRVAFGSTSAPLVASSRTHWVSFVFSLDSPLCVRCPYAHPQWAMASRRRADVAARLSRFPTLQMRRNRDLVTKLDARRALLQKVAEIRSYPAPLLPRLS